MGYVWGVRLIPPALRPAIVLGGLFGAGLFVAETVSSFSHAAVGLKIETEGPYAALSAAVRPFLLGLGARVVVAYLVAGIGLGLVALALWGAAFGSRWLWRGV